MVREKDLEAFVCCINGRERVEVAGLDGGGRQVFIGHLKIEPLELTYPGVSGLGGVSGECTPESPAQAESPGQTLDQTPDQIPERTGMVTGVSAGV